MSRLYVPGWPGARSDQEPAGSQGFGSLTVDVAYRHDLGFRH